jgi:hypothetical protein
MPASGDFKSVPQLKDESRVSTYRDCSFSIADVPGLQAKIISNYPGNGVIIAFYRWDRAEQL